NFHYSSTSLIRLFKNERGNLSPDRFLDTIRFTLSIPSTMGLRISRFADLFEISIQNLLFHLSTRRLIQGMGNVFKRAILSALTWHCYEESRSTADDLKIPDDKAIIQNNRDIGLKLFLIYRKNLNFRYIHGPSLRP